MGAPSWWELRLGSDCRPEAAPFGAASRAISIAALAQQVLRRTQYA